MSKQKSMGEVAFKSRYKYISWSYCSMGFQKIYERIARAVVTEHERRKRAKTCKWWDSGELWESDCGVAYVFTHRDTPTKDGHKYCHKCGKPLEELRAKQDKRRGEK